MLLFWSWNVLRANVCPRNLLHLDFFLYLKFDTLIFLFVEFILFFEACCVLISVSWKLCTRFMIFLRETSCVCSFFFSKYNLDIDFFLSLVKPDFVHGIMFRAEFLASLNLLRGDFLFTETCYMLRFFSSWNIVYWFFLLSETDFVHGSLLYLLIFVQWTLLLADILFSKPVACIIILSRC